MPEQLEELVDSLLFEGYALYPYTRAAIKNSTPTPFGIVYPPSYAERSASTFDHLRLECVLLADAPVQATVRFLQASGENHEAVERRIEVDQAETPVPFEFDGLEGRVRLRTDSLEDGRVRVRCCVHNTTDLENGADADRPTALRSSLLSTHVLVRAQGGTFLTPLEADVQSVNTFPVLATRTDDAVLGAAIVLPDHPQLAPESRGSLFDNTEIEEALLLHVHALSDAEREDIASSQDPALRAMLARAEAATPQDIMSLHGRLEMHEPALPPGMNTTGEDAVEVDGVTYAVGGKVRLRPNRRGDTLDTLLVGRLATIGRIHVDYEDKAYLGVTVDDDPAADLFGDTGRFLFFFSDEVEVVAP